ncbi:MAG: 50S ribosomal protein L11 methyltransferase [Dehalococcoidia bacterium]
MDYLELAVSVRPEAVEAAADLLRRHAPSGVSIEPQFRALDEDGGLAFDDAAPVSLRAWLVADSSASRRAVVALRKELRALGEGVVHPLRSRTVRDARWAETWKRHFPVLRLGQRLVIKPAWRRHRARPGDVVVEVDPGLAFGTGQHETTRMCLEALEECMRPGATVLDLGCGSGILSAAAALLGAARVDALDVDPAAIKSTSENIARNGVGALVHVAEGSLGGAWPFAEAPDGRYDVVLGNLSARVIRELAGEIVRSLRADGVALLSGIVAEQEVSCWEALAAAGGRVIDQRADGDWRLLVVTPS